MGKDNNKEKRFQCNICQYIQQDNHVILKNIRTNSVHENINYQKCEDCEKAFSTRSNLTQHVVAVHTLHRKYRKVHEAVFPDPPPTFFRTVGPNAKEGLDGLGNFSFVVCSAVRAREMEKSLSIGPANISSLLSEEEDGLDLVREVQVGI